MPLKLGPREAAVVAVMQRWVQRATQLASRLWKRSGPCETFGENTQLEDDEEAMGKGATTEQLLAPLAWVTLLSYRRGRGKKARPLTEPAAKAILFNAFQARSGLFG